MHPSMLLFTRLGHHWDSGCAARAQSLRNQDSREARQDSTLRGGGYFSTTNQREKCVEHLFGHLLENLSISLCCNWYHRQPRFADDKIMIDRVEMVKEKWQTHPSTSLQQLKQERPNFPNAANTARIISSYGPCTTICPITVCAEAFFF